MKFKCFSKNKLAKLNVKGNYSIKRIKKIETIIFTKASCRRVNYMKD